MDGPWKVDASSSRASGPRPARSSGVDNTRALIVLLLAVLLLPGPIVRAVVHSQHPPLVTIKVRTMPFLAYAALHVAQQEGLFANEGLDVQLVDMEAGTPVVPALVRGDIDVLPAVMSPALLNAIARGARIRIVGSMMDLVPGRCTSQSIVVRRQVVPGGMLTPVTGSGPLRISGARAPISAFLLDKALASVRISADQLEHVDMPDAIEGEALRSGRVDLAVLSEPWLTRAMDTGEVVLWKRLEDVLPSFEFLPIMYGPNLLDLHNDVGHRFMRAYLAAAERLRAGRTPRNLEILASHTGLDRALLGRMCWPETNTSGELGARGLLDFQEWALAKGLIDRVLPLASVVDSTFLDRARQAGARP